MAVATGLRYSEIKSIKPESFTLAGADPTLTVEAAYTKNGVTASFDLNEDLVADLGPWLADRPRGIPVFSLPDKGADMIRVDLDTAGIPYRDAAGLFFDFHSLRCQLATVADEMGLSPRRIQKLMRHSTLELTGRYTRPRADDLKQAVSALPSFRPRSTLQANSTDAQSSIVNQKVRAANAQQMGDVPGRTMTEPDAIKQKDPADSPGHNLLESPVLA